MVLSGVASLDRSSSFSLRSCSISSQNSSFSLNSTSFLRGSSAAAQDDKLSVWGDRAVTVVRLMLRCARSGEDDAGGLVGCQQSDVRCADEL